MMFLEEGEDIEFITKYEHEYIANSTFSPEVLILLASFRHIEEYKEVSVCASAEKGHRV